MTANNISENMHIKEMYDDYYLEYASYVITDRAVPYLEDGLKPVQRRILHSLREMEDGRFHKAANVIGSTMKFHPHGDAAIGDALVNLGQKNLMIDTQGNWGDPLTGDSAAAPRYIECKLSKFALEVAFHKRITEWQNSYDGRNKEPVVLPIKFPLVLAQGAEGIAVGLSTKILPHNFVELLENCIKILKKEPFILYPDFPSGGSMDVSNYNDGQSGGRIKVRATITKGEKRSLVITEIPFGTTTTSLMESIVNANDKGKIKVKRIEDNTAANVNIVIYLPPGAEEDKSIDALYAFTECETSLAPNCCIIRNKRPAFIGVSEMLRENVKDTVAILKAELELRKSDLEEKWHMRTLERIFIEERIYRLIEKCETWDAILKTIREGLEPFKKQFIREVTEEDLTRLTEIRIKRISRFDAAKADDEFIALEKELAEVNKHLRHLTKYAIKYFENLLAKYGPGRERKTRIDQFQEIAASEVILSNLKVFFDRETGFIGTGVRANECVSDCSKLDDVIVFTEDGTMVVTKVAPKTYVGKNILYAARFDKNDKDTIYNLIYRDGHTGPTYIKRFAVGGVTRDKQYALTKGKENSKIHYFSTSARITAEQVIVKLVPKPRIKKEFPVTFAQYDVKGRGSSGNIISKYAVRKVSRTKDSTTVKEPADTTTISPEISQANSLPAPVPKVKEQAPETGTPLFWDKKNNLIGFKVNGIKICSLETDDCVLLLYNDGSYITYKGQNSMEVGDGIVYLSKFSPDQVFSVIYTDGNTRSNYAKRFNITTPTNEKYFYFISDYEESHLNFLSADSNPIVDLEFKPQKGAKSNKMRCIMDDKHIPVTKVSHIGEIIAARIIKSAKLSKNNQLSLL